MRRWTMARNSEKQLETESTDKCEKSWLNTGACTHSFDEPQKQQGNVLMERLQVNQNHQFAQDYLHFSTENSESWKTLSLWKRDGWSPDLLKIFWLTCSRLPHAPQWLLCTATAEGLLCRWIELDGGPGAWLWRVLEFEQRNMF